MQLDGKVYCLMAKRYSLSISVVVTTRERPGFLRKVLSGYLDQTRPPDELIVADDGSGESTAAVVRTFTRQAPFRVVHAWQEHTGTVRLSHLRNLATRMSRGNYVIYTDGDCIPTRHFVADHECLARRGTFIQGKRMWIKRRVRWEFTGRESTGQMLKMILGGAVNKPHWLIHVPGISIDRTTIDGVRGCNMSFFREDSVNGHNERFTGFWRQDSEFVLRLMRSGVRRRDAVFSAIVFHLEHSKEFIDEDYQRNSALLQRARTSPVFTPHGLYPMPDSCQPLHARRMAA